ncbi:PA14 domain-containing protein [Catellatospora bangladeshensis]|uniref:PA14 domain-containing protein n=1 Tax=Catellatospora bangladeshensis TaxID=310355 RepID=UPI00360B9A68
MGRRLLRRLRGPVLATLTLALAGGVWAVPATAAIPAQEPGVTLRVYDLQVSLTELCTLKAAQTPNVDKLMPTVNWTTAADFGFEDRFLAQVIGNLNITTAGSYAFRLTSDDGSELKIDGAMVIDHDGLHGATAKEGAVTLTTGYHALNVNFFEATGGQQLTLEWRPPGASAYTLVPNSALSTDAGVVRVTAPAARSARARPTPRRRAAADRRAPRLHADQPAAGHVPAQGHRYGLAARRPPGDLHLGRQRPVRHVAGR